MIGESVIARDVISKWELAPSLTVGFLIDD